MTSPNIRTKAKRSGGLIAASSALLLALTACEGGVTASSTTDQIELEVATFAPPGSIPENVTNRFFEMVEERSDGQLTFNVTAPESVCPANEIATCVQDGRVDVGITIPDYNAQLFPTIALVSVPFLTDDAQALMGALHEVNASHEGARNLWEQNGLHPLAHFSPGRLILGTEEPIDSIDGIQGQRWRVSGEYLQESIEAAQGSNVALTAPETYEAIQRGVADAVGFPMDGATQFHLMELLPHWSDPGSGHYTTIGFWMNADTYNGLPDDLRNVVDEVTEELNGGMGVEAFAEVAAEQCEALSETAESITRWPEDGSRGWEEAIGDDLINDWVQSAEELGLEDAEGYREAFLAALETHRGDTEDPMDTCLDQQ